MKEINRLLIVNADDFGLNDSATDGIVESHVAGSVTSTTLMANAPGVERAAKHAAIHPALGVGLHFNLTWGRPITAPRDVPALVDQDGAFLSREMLARRLFMGRVPAEQIKVELQAQWEKVLSFGIKPTHVDSHQHVHAFGGVFSSVAQHCASSNIPMRVPWVAAMEAGGIARRLRRALLASMLRSATRPWRGRVRWNDGMGSIFDIGVRGEELDDSHYQRILRASSGRCFELMVHPVTNARAMDGYTSIGAVSEAEWRYLRRGSVANIARAQGFRLGNYRDLVK